MSAGAPSGAGGQGSGGLLEWTKNNLAIVAGIAGVAALGYAVYYDHKRRADPDYKQKIREKRREKQAARTKQAGRAGGAGLGEIDVPNPLNPTDMQAFFLQEVQLGEELMTAGNVEEGAEHIANAVLICGQSNQLLSIFQQTLPPEHFALVLEKMPTASDRMAERFGRAADVLEAAGEAGPIVQELMADDDLE